MQMPSGLKKLGLRWRCKHKFTLPIFMIRSAPLKLQGAKLGKTLAAGLRPPAMDEWAAAFFCIR